VIPENRVRSGAAPDRRSPKGEAGSRAGVPSRTLPIPDSLRAVLARGKTLYQPGEFVFAGTKQGAMTSGRTIERAIRRSAGAAGIHKPVNCMTLRHSYAIACLKAGVNVREVQEALGHARIETTMRYQNMLVATQVKSPADMLSFGPIENKATASEAQATSGDSTVSDLPPEARSARGADENVIEHRLPITDNPHSRTPPPTPIAVDCKINADLAEFPFAEIRFDFRKLFTSIRAFFRFG
jgi:hypothetical protein